MLGSMSTRTAEHSPPNPVSMLHMHFIYKNDHITDQHIPAGNILICSLIFDMLFFTTTGKKVSKAPKIQRLVTPLTLQRKRARIADKKKRIAKAKSEAVEYQKLLATRLKEQRERRSESLAKKRSRLSAASKPSVAA